MNRIKTTSINLILLTTVLCLEAQNPGESVTVPFILDHNRMIINAEFKAVDGSWKKARLWVDSGNPKFIISERFAEILGIETKNLTGSVDLPDYPVVKLGELPVSFEGVPSAVDTANKWLFNTMHIEANLPSTVLMKYDVIFDYPAGNLTLCYPGTIKPDGIPSAASVNYKTGIIQIDAEIDGGKYSFALDNGSSFSYTSDVIVRKLYEHHPEWPESTGAVACANIWGWWPDEEKWKMIKIPSFKWGSVNITDAIFAGLPPIFRNGSDVGTNYSRKSVRPVNGFIGPNIFKDFRIHISYSDSTVFFKKSNTLHQPEADVVGITIRLLDDMRYEIAGVAEKNGIPLVDGLEKGDILLQVGNLMTTGATMGTVSDALRGKPGETRILKILRNGKEFSVKAIVVHIL
jgi:hypothetical protein